jgi:death on curing protein
MWHGDAGTFCANWLRARVEFVGLIVVYAAHELALAQEGGAQGIRDTNLLESAVNRARTRFSFQPESSVAELATAYAYGIVRDHPFVDGNKRTAYLVSEAFCNLNGWRLEADDMESIIIFRALAAGEIEEVGLTKWFERHLRAAD